MFLNPGPGQPFGNEQEHRGSVEDGCKQMSDVYSHVYPSSCTQSPCSPINASQQDRDEHYHTILTLAQPRGLTRKDVPLLPSWIRIRTSGICFWKKLGQFHLHAHICVYRQAVIILNEDFWTDWSLNLVPNDY